MQLPYTACAVLSMAAWHCYGSTTIRSQTNVDVTYRWVYKNPIAGDRSGSAATAELKPLLYSHMGMLALLPNGSLAAAWQGSEVFWEGSDKQGIFWATSDDGGTSWGGHRSLVPAPDGLPAWGPVLHTEGKEVHMFYAVSRQKCWWQGEGGMHWACGGNVMMQSSSDRGCTWSSPKVIYSYNEEGGIAKMLANHLGMTSGGGWMLPVWREMGGQAVCNTHPELHGAAGVLLSDDQGMSWNVHNISLADGEKPTWLIEGAVASIGGRSWLQVFRTTAGFMYSSRSDDDGVSWTPATPTHVRNPNSKVDILALEDDVLILAYNDDSEASRSTLLLALSTDEGRSWHDIAVLEADPRGSFHYPTLLFQEKQDTVLVIYSVDFLPNTSMLGRTASSNSSSIHSGAQWRCESPQNGKAQHDGREERIQSQSSQCRPTNAWGKESWGMRLATLPAAAVRGIVSDIREGRVAAA